MCRLPLIRFGILAAALAPAAQADDAVVGNGHAVGCTEAAFDAALGQLYPGANFPGGTITFDCGPGPITILFTSAKGIGLGTGTTIDGGGTVTLDGGNTTRLFNITGTQSRVELRNLVIERGFVLGENGGAVYVAAENSLLIADSLLRDSESTASGGALFAEIDTGVAIERSSFVGNEAGSGGGGLMVNGSLNVSGSLFANNDAPNAEGGGMLIYGDTVNVTNTRLENNDARDGAGVLLRGGMATFVDVHVEGNVASGRGGGIMLYGEQNLQLQDSVVLGNFADQGGGIYIGGIDDGPGTADTIRSNALYAIDSRIEGNQAREGGGAYVFGVAPFHTGHVGVLTVNDLDVAGNSAERGGGIYTQGYLEGDSLLVRENMASLDGAGLYLAPTIVASLAGIASQTGHTILTRPRILRNEATHAGGGVYGTQALLFGEGFWIEANYAAFGGGVAYVDSSLAVLQYASVVNNYAGQAGGGVYIDSASAGAYVADSTLSSNELTGPGKGGQLYVTTDIGSDPSARTTLEILGSTIVTDQSASAGASLYADQSTTLRYARSILAHPETMTGVCESGPASSVTSDGNNLQVGFICDGGMEGDNTVSTRAALLLGELADNGGAMPTHLPRPGSPAVDHHPCPTWGPTTSMNDQRGLPRGIDGTNDGLPWCDAGAIERQEDETAPLFSDGFESDGSM